MSHLTKQILRWIIRILPAICILWKWVPPLNLIKEGQEISGIQTKANSVQSTCSQALNLRWIRQCVAETSPWAKRNSTSSKAPQPSIKTRVICISLDRRLRNKVINTRVVQFMQTQRLECLMATQEVWFPTILTSVQIQPKVTRWNDQKLTHLSCSIIHCYVAWLRQSHQKRRRLPSLLK